MSSVFFSLEITSAILLKDKKKKILAISSSGGHWTQMQRITSSFSGNEVVYVSKPSFNILYKSLTSIRSANYLRARYFFAMKYGPIGWLYFMFDFIRIFGSFLFYYSRLMKNILFDI